MRPNTSESGIFSTNRNRPVSTSMLTRMLVPKPKNAFQSPGVHNAGRYVVDVAMMPLPRLSLRQRCQRRARARHPAKNAALRLDHREAGGVKFREIRGAAIRQHDA